MRRLDGVEIAVGIQGTVDEGPSTLPELVQIALAHEFGAGVPLRPFLRTSLAKHRMRWSRGLKVFAAAWARGEYAAAEVQVRRVGVAMVGDVQGTIRDEPWAPNSAATIARKGSDKPLIDTGQMRQSIRAEVRLPGHRELIG